MSASAQHFDPTELIRSKRDGQTLTSEAIRFLVEGASRGTIPDYQLAALLMAIYFRGLSTAELSVLTDAMMHSGDVLDLSAIAAVSVDKHSTGGVGDKISICLAPLVAACDICVPMLAGRGLGHTGGTLDKLESIPGYRVDLNASELIEAVRHVGAAISGQTGSVAPADKRLYALRDVTGTVESIPLIASSIMSKKLAAGIDALVLDVKWGSGAFMKNVQDAEALAQTMISIGRAHGRRIKAIVSDMNQPLGRAIGNSNELVEAIDILRGEGPPDVWELTRTLAIQMLLLADPQRDEDDAGAAVDRARNSGAGLERLQQMVEQQAGNPRYIEDTSLLPHTSQKTPFAAKQPGFIDAIDAERIGLAALRLGAGRRVLGAKINHGAGLTMEARVGDAVTAGQPLVMIHSDEPALIGAAQAELTQAFSIGSETPAVLSLVHGLFE